MKFLDLRQFQDETFDIDLLNGIELQLPKPTLKLYMKLIDFQNQGTEGKTDKEVEGIVDNFILSLFNTNISGQKVIRKDIKHLNMPAKLAILKAYTEFTYMLTSQKN